MNDVEDVSTAGPKNRPGTVFEKAVRLLPLLVVAAGVLAYANSFGNPFIFDDSVVITRNPDISRIWPIAMSSRFVVDMSFKLNYAIAGFNVADYHALNLLIHVLSGLFLYGIIRRTMMLPSLKQVYAGSGPWLAAVCAAMWVAHPLQTQSVTYICQRYESMMGLFFFAALYFFVRGVTAGQRQRLWFNMSIGACALGMGTKEIMVTAPVVILLYDYVFIGPSVREMLKRRWKIYVALSLAWLLLAVFQFAFVSENIAAGKTGSRMASSPVSYLFTQFGVITHYIRLTLVPVGLCLDYMWPPAEGLREILPYGVLIGSLFVFSCVGVWRRKAWGFLGAAFFVVLGPTSSIMPIADRAFEHRMYVPLAPAVVLFVVFAYNLTGRLFNRCGVLLRTGVRVGLAGVVLVLLIAMTVSRNLDYKSEEAMWRDVVEKRPGNARAYLGLSSGLLKQGRYAESEECGRMLISLLPDFARINESQIPNPGITGDERLFRYKAWLYASARNNIGASMFNRGELDGAFTSYREAVRIMPDHMDAVANLARTYMAMEKPKDAEVMWKKLLTLSSSDSLAHSSLALLYFDRDDYRKAVSHFSRALESDPENVIAQLGLSWLLSTCARAELRDGRMAVELAHAVCRTAEYKSPAALDALAAACAEAGDFENAVKYAERSISLLRSSGTNSTSGPGQEGVMDQRKGGGDPIEGNLTDEDVEARLKLYKSGKPYRMLRNAMSQPAD
jgi:tetratricopeptide (TPR) repeat protein